MKKILIDAYLVKNFGDDLFLYILFSRYKNNNIQWTINCYDQDYVNIFKNFKNVEVKKYNVFHKIGFKFSIIRKLIFAYQGIKNDALIMIGGSIFMQQDYWKQQMEYNKQKIEGFKNKNKKVFILGSNFGPFKHESFTNFYKEIFKVCDDVCFRDEYSYNLFKDVSSVRLATDIVLTLPSNGVKQEKDTVGISVIDVGKKEELKSYKKDYVNKIVEIIDKNVQNGKKVKLLSFCEYQDDLKVSEEIFNLVENKSRVEIFNYTGNIEEYLDKFGGLEVIIGTRFHSVILSLVYGQEVYPLIYSDKTYNILKDMDLSKSYSYIKDIADLDVDNIDNLLKSNKICNIKSVKEKAELQFKRLDEFMLNEELK